MQTCLRSLLLIALLLAPAAARAQDGSFVSAGVELHYRSAASGPPVVLLSGGFAEVWHGIENLLTGLSASERAAVLGGTAERIYRI